MVFIYLYVFTTYIYCRTTDIYWLVNKYFNRLIFSLKKTIYFTQTYLTDPSMATLHKFIIHLTLYFVKYLPRAKVVVLVISWPLYSSHTPSLYEALHV